jgi:hypothetical protein
VRKADSYVVHGPGNLIGIRDKKVYAKKKKVFQPGFSDASLRLHEPKVIGQIDIFCEKVLEHEEPGKASTDWTEPKNMVDWC